MLRIKTQSMNVKSSFSVREFLTGILAVTLTTATDRNMLVHSDIQDCGKVGKFQLL